MDICIEDFGAAERYFEDDGAVEWAELESVLSELTPHFQPSDEAGKQGSPIFDPKGTNAALNRGVRQLGWVPVPVPEELTMFGVDWDAGKGEVLAEWQFSNYPFLWNNVIRTQAVMTGNVRLVPVEHTSALVVVTKSGLFPASQSTLYFEQARAQLDAVMTKGAFDLPVRLVGLTIDNEPAQIDAIWSTYPGRYAREPETRDEVEVAIMWGRRNQYGTRKARFEVLDL